MGEVEEVGKEVKEVKEVAKVAKGAKAAKVAKAAGVVKGVEVTGVAMELSRFLAPCDQLPH